MTRWRAVVAKKIKIVRSKLRRALTYARTVVDRRKSHHKGNMAGKPVGPTRVRARSMRAGYLQDRDAGRPLAKPHKHWFEQANEQVRMTDDLPSLSCPRGWRQRPNPSWRGSIWVRWSR